MAEPAPRPAAQLWPPLPYADWEPTKQTLHRYVQMVGKLRMALVPPRNHWWHVTLGVATQGVTTGPMPYRGASAEVLFDLVDHRLRVLTSDGADVGFPLRDSLPCADFHAALGRALREAGVAVPVPTEPFDLGDSPPFPEDTRHRSYDPGAVERWWAVLRATDQALARFASRFSGKASPTHLFWHSFDLAHARFSGRRAPEMPGADPVTAEAYSHEIIAFGWWPGDDRRTPYPAFYSYTAPEPVGLRERRLAPAEAAWHDAGTGSLAILPYDAVRAAADPAGAVLAFYESAYQAGAEAAGWDLVGFRTSLDSHGGAGSD
jgi:hypothetical protein